MKFTLGIILAIILVSPCEGQVVPEGGFSLIIQEQPQINPKPFRSYTPPRQDDIPPIPSRSFSPPGYDPRVPRGCCVSRVGLVFTRPSSPASRPVVFNLNSAYRSNPRSWFSSNTANHDHSRIRHIDVSTPAGLSAARKWGVRVVPTVLFLDKCNTTGGVCVARWEGRSAVIPVVGGRPVNLDSRNVIQTLVKFTKTQRE